jgi:hypothetical protein
MGCSMLLPGSIFPQASVMAAPRPADSTSKAMAGAKDGDAKAGSFLLDVWETYGRSWLLRQ